MRDEIPFRSNFVTDEEDSNFSDDEVFVAGVAVAERAAHRALKNKDRVRLGRERSRKLIKEQEEASDECEELRDEEEDGDAEEGEEDLSEEGEETDDSDNGEVQASEDGEEADALESGSEDAETEEGDGSESRDEQKKKREEKRKAKKEKREQKKEYKKTLNRRYAKELRETKNDAEKATTAAGRMVEKLTNTMTEVFYNPDTFMIGLVIALIIACVGSLGSSASTFTVMLMNAFTGGAKGSFYSEASDIEACENYAKSFECTLEEDIAAIDQYHPNFDEYAITVGKIGHNPIELIAYLSMKHPRFTFDEVKGEIDDLLNRMYVLDIFSDTEVRTEERVETVQVKKTRMVTREKPVVKYKKVSVSGISVYLPYTEMITVTEEEEYFETETQTVEMDVEVEVLYATLFRNSISYLVNEELKNEEITEEQYEQYETYLSTGGGLQLVSSPIDDSWMDKISCQYGYRIHPIDKERQFHKGVDIAIPEGTPIYAGVIGTVTESAYQEGYGNVITIESTGGILVRYAHLQSRLVEVGDLVSPINLIAYSGNTGKSTGPHLHLEVRKGTESYNPIFYVTAEREHYD